MSHSVTIRTQTVTSGSSTIVLNTGYLKTWSGILKLSQLALGIICIGLAGHKPEIYYYGSTEEMFFLLMATTFMIGTCILLISCITSFSTASIISKTIYDLLYHAFAFALLLASSLALLVHVNNYRNKREHAVMLLLIASVCGLINAALYLLNTIMAVRAYRA